MEELTAPQPSNAITLTPIGTFSTGVFDESAAEIVAFDPGSQRLFVVNANNATIDILDVSDPSNPVANPMSEDQEVPPITDGPATGDFTFTISSTNVLTVTGTFSGLSSALNPVGAVDAEGNPVSAIHVHTADAGTNGPILRNLTVTTFGDGLSGVYSGEFQLTADEAAAALDEGFYVNLHTINNPSGELRGQFVQSSIDATNLGGGANSVDVANGIVAVAIEADNSQDPGTIAFYTTDGDFLNSVTVGALPDMVTFTPDGTKLIVANEGEPNDDYSVDPEGSVSIIDISEAGNDLAGLTQDNVSTADFIAFNDRIEDLRGRGVRIFGPNATVARDLEPEYIAVSGDGSTAYVSLQENNAFAVVDIETSTVLDILPLGFKDYSIGLPTLTEFSLDDAIAAESLGSTLEGEDIPLGGLSGLFFEGVDENGFYTFITHPDRGPDAGTSDVDGDGDNERIFKLPEFQPEVVRFTLDPETGNIAIVDRIGLTDGNGNPLTGLPNLEGDDNGAAPADLEGNLLEFDPLGADLEGIVVDGSGNFWMVDEYRPAVYQFDPNGALLNRFVPEGTDPNGADTFGTETLPAEYATARDNRGFEAVALDTTNGILYAFIQTPLGNDGTGTFNRDVSDESQVIRILGIDPATGTPVAEYVYLLERPDVRQGGSVDKIGDAVFDPATGNFFVIERDSGSSPESTKAIYEISLSGATNVLGAVLPAGQTLETLTPDELGGIRPVSKREVTNLPSLGYLPSDKPEGLAIVPGPTAGNFALAVLNDNDFEPEDKATVLGIVEFAKSNKLDASDEDGINLQNFPLLTAYQPDAIATFEGLDGRTYIVTANEGDARDYDTFSEEAKLADLQAAGLLDLNDDGVPDSVTDSPFAELNADDQLGEKNLTNVNGDLDGDGLIEQLVAFGGRSFSVFDPFGNLVFDSGDDFELITAEVLPEDFNSNNDENDSFDNRSDNKGPEPEAVDVGFINGIPYAFIGFERVGGIAVYDLTDPSAPEFVQYLNNRTFRDGDGNPIDAVFEIENDPATEDDNVLITNPAVGDLGPESITFIPAEDSPTGAPLIAVGNEVSGTTTLFSIDAPVPQRTTFEIQGSGDSSPLEGTVAVVEGVVTGSFEGLDGFFIQDPTGDGDPATSDGLFVDAPGVTVSPGDIVRVTGTVVEFFGQTQLGENVVVETLGTNGGVTPIVIDLPVASVGDLEALEGMLVTFPEALFVTDVFNLGRFGEVLLSSDGTLPIPTEVAQPGAAANDVAAANALQQILLDDGSNESDPETTPFVDRTGDNPVTLRRGSTVEGLTGNLGFGFGNYRVQPTEEPTFDFAERPAVPDVGDAEVTIAAFNVLNYFTTIDDGNTLTGPNGDQSPRGADSQNEFERQEAKIVAALLELNADIVGLVEIENNGDTAVSTLVDALNSAIGATTYSFISDPAGFTTVPGGDDAIKTAFIYKPAVVTPVGDAQTINDESFAIGRAPVAQTFETVADGEVFTAIVNHFKSKGSSGAEGDDLDQGDGQGAFNATRVRQAEALAGFVTDLQASTGDSDVIVIGDINAYPTEDPIATLEDAGLTRLETDPTFVFFGQEGALDHALVTSSLNGQVTGAAAWAIDADEPRSLDYEDNIEDNTDDNFERTNADPSLFQPDPFRSSDHDPVLVGLNLDSSAFTLELLHGSDQEAGSAAVRDAPGFSAVLNALRAQDVGDDGLEDNTITLSSGDAFIPGVFFDASEAVFGAPGIADILIQNELGFQAIALGNHEFDFGSEVLADLISGAAGSEFEGIDGLDDFTGTNFPYLSANLDFSTDVNLAPLETEGGQPPAPNTVTSSTVIDVNGELIGVVGATTPTLASISSPDGVGVLPSPFDSNPTPEQLDALAAVIQSEVDALLAANPEMNKVILLSHMQRIAIEEELATRLTNVDIIVAGGSNTRLFDENDRPRDGDSVQGEYPKFFTNAGGTQTALVNTDGSYKYVGRLVLDFDSAGNIIPESYDPSVSGAYATDDQGVEDLNAGDLVDPEVQAIADAIGERIFEIEGNILGVSEVFLNGNRSGVDDDPTDLDGVRTQETNLGNLTADANLAAAKESDATVVLSLKNGGGIRASIGQTLVPPGGDEPERLPTEEILDDEGNVVKPEGGISQNDIQTTLAFNNGLTLLTLTKTELIDLLEHGVSAIPGVSGRFPQIAGVAFSYDPDLEAGDRILTASILDENGELLTELVRDGEIVGDANELFRIVTLNFLAAPRFDDDGNFIGGGDGYPFPNTNTDPDLGEVGDPDVIERVNTVQLEQEGVTTGDAVFADDGTEQDALAEYLLDNFPNDDDPNTPVFGEEDTGRDVDERIQNLNFREDTVPTGDDGEPFAGPIPTFGTLGDDVLDSALGDFDGTNALVFAGSGNDLIDNSTSGGSRLFGGSGNNEILAGTNDRAFGGANDDILDSSAGGGGNRLYGLAGDDFFFLGSTDRAFGGGDNDAFFFPNGGGDNLVTGGEGDDQFWVANAILPTSANTFTDFTIGSDVIGIAGIDGITEFEDVILGGTDDATISLGEAGPIAVLLGVTPDSLSSSDFLILEGPVTFPA
ncbi:putative extracellular nuclease [Rubidibacter lacunae KORDI 51-2]|uniref:Putative extracellular nuclease n=1 Tax=Rubidibacter lacunae KORDI 51-2 TaxID=582515 RepID=U5DPD1_9CHRO|nr:ExeM/NucH family extracellular endonuclease [Rubidibacter lacunae]ERN42464.1 putative extracellular nuclease [Rubidibacter lacunae KORDI 51-2]